MDIDTPIAGLVAAFPPRPIDPTHAFDEWGRMYTDYRRFEDAVRGREWPHLEERLLQVFHDALVFFGPSSIADYLPAYVAAYVRGASGALAEFLVGVLTRSFDAERFDSRFAQLSAGQRLAIARALAAVEASRTGVTDALDSHWRSQLALEVV